MAGTTSSAGADEAASRGATALRLDPRNPHYYEFRGEPTVLITSTSYYGSVINLDFDYRRYLETLAREDLNLTRVFPGTFVEAPDRFASLKIKSNLGPAPNRLLVPWARSSTPGYANGGNKFDLSRWDPAYFARLRDFVEEASRRGIVVEISLFSVNYDDTTWQASPLNGESNVNGVGNVDRDHVYDFTDPGLQAAQEAVVRKIVTELSDFDNVTYEIINEPYLSKYNPETEPVDPAWQARIAEVIQETEASLPPRQHHLISQGVDNVSALITEPNPAVSVLSFHYAVPEAVSLNYGLNRLIADDETGFVGSRSTPYRLQAWRFLLAGGAEFDNLDFSFTVDSPEGEEQLAPDACCSGGPEIRFQLSVLKEFIEGFDFEEMAPEPSLVGGLPANVQAQALARRGHEYAVYFDDGGFGRQNGGATESSNMQLQIQPTLAVPNGRYRVEWLNPKTGRVQWSEAARAKRGGGLTPRSPTFVQDVALRVTRR